MHESWLGSEKATAGKRGPVAAEAARSTPRRNAWRRTCFRRCRRRASWPRGRRPRPRPRRSAAPRRAPWATRGRLGGCGRPRRRRWRWGRSSSWAGGLSGGAPGGHKARELTGFRALSASADEDARRHERAGSGTERRREPRSAPPSGRRWAPEGAGFDVTLWYWGGSAASSASRERTQPSQFSRRAVCRWGDVPNPISEKRLGRQRKIGPGF